MERYRIIAPILMILAVIGGWATADVAPRPHDNQERFDQRLPAKLVLVGDEKGVVWHNQDASEDWWWFSILGSPNMVSDQKYIWPHADGAANSLLATDGTGVLFWGPFDANSIIYDSNDGFQLPDKTPGSIMFAHTDGFPLHEDNDNFYFDDVNDRIGIALSGTRPNNYIQVQDLIEFNNTLSNTELGWQAGNGITVGVRNSFGGYQAGLYTDADDNTAWGYHALGGAGAGAAATYPTLRTTTSQADPGLTQTTAIANVTDLQAMENDLTGNYYLTGDIDASATSGWNGGAGFDPIGPSAVSPFTGTFDGAGYTITGLVVNRPTEQRNGLFGQIQGTAKIANVTLANCSITGDEYTAPLVGYVDSQDASEPLIQNCHASGTVTSRPGEVNSSYHAGLIGWAQGHKASGSDVLIYDCTTSVTVTTSGTTGTSNHAGGFVAWTERVVISNCSATGNVSAGDDSDKSDTGGFIAELNELTFIDYCFATGDVDGYNIVGGFLGDGISGGDGSYIKKSYATGDVTAALDNAGGFAGENADHITDCYATGDVTITAGTGDVGGFTGIDRVPADPDYTNCYSTGTVTGGDNAAGFVANSQAGSYTAVFWDTESSGNATSDGGVGHTTKWMQTRSNFTAAGWDFDTIWTMAGGNIIRATGIGSYALSKAESGADAATALGYKAGESVTSAGNGLYLGPFAGNRQTTVSNRLFIDNQDRGSAASDLTDSLIWGLFSATPADQTLQVNAKATVEQALFLSERAAAMADVTADGQLWVKDDAPNTLYFTDDAGNDTQITAGGGGLAAGTASSDTEVLYDNSGTIDGDSTFTFNDTTKDVTMQGLVVSNTARATTLISGPKIPEALVTFVFDDGFDTTYDLALPAFNAQGEVACSAVATDLLNTGGYLTDAEVQALYAAGWEISSHTKTHTDLTTLTEAQITTELTLSRTAIEALDVQVNTMVYPYNASNTLVRQLARKYYIGAAGHASQGINRRVVNTWNLHRHSADDHTLLATYQGYVDTAETDETWLILYLHGITADDVTTLDALIDYIQAKSIQIVTLNEGLSLLGNTIDVGDSFGAGERGVRVDSVDGSLVIEDEEVNVSFLGKCYSTSNKSAANYFYRARGTRAAPTAIQNGDTIGFFGFVGHDGSDWSGSQAYLRARAHGNWTGASKPTYMDFFTTPTGSTTAARRLFISQNGNIGLGGEAAPATLLELTHATPIIQQQASPHTNADDGRKSIWRAKGNKTDETEHTLGQFSFSHDGTGDDFLAKYVLGLNKDAGADTLSDILTATQNSFVVQAPIDSTTFFQVLDADGGTPIFSVDSTNEQVTIGYTSATYPFLINSTDTSDQIQVYHDNFAAYFKTTDGSFNFITDEGTDTATFLRIKGKGNAFGSLQVFDQDDAEWITFYANNGEGNLSVLGTSPVVLNLQWDGNIPIKMFAGSSEGETQELQVYGFPTGDASRSLQIGVGVDAADSCSLDGLSLYWLRGNLKIGEGTAATDYTITADGETNDGVITWMEDEAHWQFADDIAFVGSTIVYDVNNISADVATFETYGIHIIDSSGAGVTGTLAAGTKTGQSVKFVCKVAGNNIDITVSNHVTSDPEVIRLDTAKEWVELVWDGTDWVEVDGNGQTYP